MEMKWRGELRERLDNRKKELEAKLERIGANVRRPLDADSAERAKQLEDQEVVDSLGNEARDELAKVLETQERLDSGRFGVCVSCDAEIGEQRLVAYPYADHCIRCAKEIELST